METKHRQCLVCKQWFEATNGLVSCPAHSFGETEEAHGAHCEIRGTDPICTCEPPKPNDSEDITP